MKKIISIFVALVAVSLNTILAQENEEVKAIITTEYGKIKIKLYNETPLHRDNFVKLVKANFYSQTELHRIIKGFMIQGGDVPKTASQATKDSFKYTIPAEIVAKYYHKRGAIAKYPHASPAGRSIDLAKEGAKTREVLAVARSISAP